MDKDIIKEVNKGKKRRIAIYALLMLALLAFILLMIRNTLQSTLKKEEVISAMVVRGDIENTINASGEILPEFEQVISSPITAPIEQAFVDAGMTVKKGQKLLSLDKTNTKAEYDRLKFGLESKRNQIQKLKLDLDESFSDLKSENDIKQLRINSLKASLEDAKRLFKAGGGSREDIEKAELSVKVAALEKIQLENEIKTKQQSMRIEMKESQIAADIQENDLNQLQRKLSLTDIIASRDGVVTWINKNIGSNVRDGEALVRIADLSEYKVAGSISDNYLDQLHNNMTAIIRINDSSFRGKVTNINPAVHGGLISFDVQMVDKKNKLFRPNMKVDVFLVTDAHNGILKVRNGPAFKGAMTQQIFVLKGQKAERRTVHIGLTNFDFVELKDNVHEGDLVITSDMSGYANANEITLK